ncbi:hypothetical protein ACFWF7_18340 [Nocardia sp. NPDC060256]|uniref:hypothetical protein n=1 Tax=unclassified Nocardia TaxID=2637762 RepID=UPI00364ED201
MVIETPDGEQFRFLIEAAFTVTGRGTAVVGYVESGVTSVGDRLHLVRADGRLGPSDICWAIEAVINAGQQPDQPAPIGLVFRTLRKSDFEPGDVIVGDVEGS